MFSCWIVSKKKNAFFLLLRPVYIHTYIHTTSYLCHKHLFKYLCLSRSVHTPKDKSPMTSQSAYLVIRWVACLSWLLISIGGAKNTQEPQTGEISKILLHPAMISWNLLKASCVPLRNSRDWTDDNCFHSPFCFLSYRLTFCYMKTFPFVSCQPQFSKSLLNVLQIQKKKSIKHLSLPYMPWHLLHLRCMVFFFTRAESIPTPSQHQLIPHRQTSVIYYIVRHLRLHTYTCS